MPIRDSTSASATSTVPGGSRGGSIPLAIIGGVVAACIGAALCGGVSYAINRQSIYLVIGVGFLTGFAVRWLGKGQGIPFQLIGALTALLGVVMGQIFMIELIVHKKYGMWPALGDVVGALQSSISWINCLIYGIALYCGWKFSVK